MNRNNLSADSSNDLSEQIHEFNVRKKLASICNRIGFLKQCIAEQVLPKSAPRHLHDNNIPFTNAARMYLLEACQNLKDELVLLQEKRKGISISRKQMNELKGLNEKQRASLNNKLVMLCRGSMWRAAGRSDIVTNLSAHELSENEREALSLGYKFSTGKDSEAFVDHLKKKL